jgi:hypothetical protein
MTNKDQLDQTSEGHQVLALMAENFSAEQFQPALTLIEQRYTEDLTVWDAELNHDSKLPFHRTTAAGRLLVFFASPDHLAKIKDELEQREAEHAIKMAEGPARNISATAKPKAKGKTRAIGAARKARGRKVKTAKAVKKSPKRQRSKPAGKRSKQKSLSAKARKSPTKKNRKSSKSKRR